VVNVEPHCGGVGDHHDEGREGPLITNVNVTFADWLCRLKFYNSQAFVPTLCSFVFDCHTQLTNPLTNWRWSLMSLTVKVLETI
jgi:hypothetical protein